MQKMLLLPWLCAVAWGSLPTSGRAADPAGTVGAEAGSSRVEARLERIEERLDRIDRKFRLLGAEDESQLLGGDAWLDRPDLLLARARADLAERQIERAYRVLGLVRTLHPASPESSEAFWLASAIFQRQYARNRIVSPDSPWNTTEPEFIFEWLGTFFAEESPAERAAAVFRGMPLSLFQRFQAHARSRPRFAAWEIAVEEDNGTIETVTVTKSRAEGVGAGPS